MGELAARVSEPSAADAALDRFFEAFYRQRPVTATFTGIHDHDGRLPDWSPAGLARAVDEMRALRRELDAVGRVPDDAVREFPTQVDLALADGALDLALAEHESEHFLHANPALWTGEAIFGVLSLVTRDFAPLPDRLVHARERLERVPGFLDQARTVLAAAPIDWKSRALRECQTASTLFGSTLPAWVATVAPASAAAWARAGRTAAQAFEAFGAWLGVPGPGRTSWSLRAPLPHAPSSRESAGEVLLSRLLTRGHFVTTPIAELLTEAEGALDEACARLDEMSRPHGGWPAVQARLADQHPPAEGYYARFHEKWAQCRRAAEDLDLVTWPDAPLRYVPFPAQTRDAAPHLYYLHYRSPAPFDPVATFDYVVAPIDGLPPEHVDARLRQWNDSVITLNHVVHHGAIGHHVQNHHAYRGVSRVGRVAAVDAASRIAMFSGGSLAEGWACYVCDLMDEVGFLTPLERIAQQHTRVRIAARAVVDLSLHSSRMTLPQATWLYEDRAGMATAAARAEAVRNSMFPGTAVMYWLGTRALHDLRSRVMGSDPFLPGARLQPGGSDPIPGPARLPTATGAASVPAGRSMRSFHDRVLSYGAIPVALIARLMLQPEASA